MKSDCETGRTICTQAMRIERVIHRYSGMTEAEFFHVRSDGNWLCCTAWIPAGEPFYPLIQARSNGITPAQAHVVMSAMQMAITWVCEEKERRQ